MITTALVRLGADPLLANGAAILTCSTVNFFASDRLVFRASAAALLLAVLAPSAPLVASGAGEVTSADGPKPHTLAAWDKDVASIDARYNDAQKSFFALDARGVDELAPARDNAEVPMIEIDPPSISDGKLHHWAGAIYIPKTTVDAVVKRMQDYAGRESEFYQEVKASKLLARDGDG